MHKKPLAFKITPTYKIWDIWEILKPNIKIVAPISIINVNGFDFFFWNSPRSCLRLLRLLQILTVQTDKTMATMKNKTPPRKKEKKQNSSISKMGLIFDLLYWLFYFYVPISKGIYYLLPINPAVTAFCLTLSGKSYFNSSLVDTVVPSVPWLITRKR